MIEDKSNLDSEMLNWIMDHKIEYPGGHELRIEQARGLRRETFSDFYNDQGNNDIVRLEAKRDEDNATSREKFNQLYGYAVYYLRSEGEGRIKAFFERRGDSLAKIRPSEDFDFIDEEWLRAICKRYGPASKAAYAARFIERFDVVFKRRDHGKDRFVDIIGLCEAWHLWSSEFTGEHAAAFWSNGASLNLKKSASARSQKSQRKIKLLELFLEEFWSRRPIFRGNANKTAEEIHADFSCTLMNSKLTPYSKKTLEKRIGSIGKPKMRRGD